MKFTPSSDWNTLVNGSNKILSWRFFVRLVDDLSEGIEPDDVLATPWIEATGFVENFADPSSKIEYEIGQFTADSVDVTGRNIAWWKEFVFNSTFKKPVYAEIKIEYRLGYSDSNVVGDVCYAFNGFVKDRPRCTELTDTVEFTAYTVEDIAGTMSAMLINAQFISGDVDGLGTSGIVLPKLKGFYVINAALAGGVMKIGAHTITYDYNAGDRRAKLDDGEWWALARVNSAITLVSKTGDQQLTLYVRVDEVGTSPNEESDIIIVDTEGDTLPRQPLFGLSTSRLLDRVYGMMGISSVRKDTLTLSTHDDRKAVSFIDYPPENPVVQGNLTAIAGSASMLFIAIGRRIYSRNMADELYSNIVEFADPQTVIKKLMYNARNNDLWMLYTRASGDYARKYNLTTSTLSAEIELIAVYDAVNQYSCELIDVNYAGSSYKYGLLWTTGGSPAQLYFIDGATMASGTAYSFASGIECSEGKSDFLFAKSPTEFGVILYKVSTGKNTYFKIWLNASGAFQVSEGIGRAAGYPFFDRAAYHSSENALYLYAWPDTATVTSLMRIPLDAPGSATTILSDVNYDAERQHISYQSGSVYTAIPEAVNIFGKVYGGTLHEINDGGIVHTETDILVYHGALGTFGGTIYGVDWFGRLFQISSTINMYHQSIDYTTLTVREYLKKILTSYMLIGYISGGKRAFVFRRGNDLGEPQTTGQTLSIGVTNTSDIKENSETYQAFDIVKLSNGNIETSYDGSRFDASVLIDARVLSVTNEMIPDNIIKDVCKYLYSYFSKDRTVYSIPLAIPAFQYEPFDGAELDFTTTKIQKTASGVLYSCTYRRSGTMDIEVLL